MNVDPGELNKKIMIVDRAGSEKDKDGFHVRKEAVIKKTYPSVNRTSIKEIMQGSREMNVTKCRFLIRYTQKAVRRGMFVVYKGRYHKIEYVNNYGDSNEYIEIMTEEGSV